MSNKTSKKSLYNIFFYYNPISLTNQSQNKNFNIDVETQKLQDNKEKGMLPKTQIYRKETHDVTFKSDRLLKEEKETLKLKQYFDDLLGHNLYDLFPEIKDNL